MVQVLWQVNREDVRYRIERLNTAIYSAHPNIGAVTYFLPSNKRDDVAEEPRSVNVLTPVREEL